VVWAGAELGLPGRDGEEARQPMPWSELEAPEHAEPLALYRRLIALRRGHPVLAEGSLRFLSAADDAVVYLRESQVQSILVVAARDAVELDLGDELPDDGELIEGRATWSSGRVHVDGPMLAAWRLPGVGPTGW